MKTIPSTCRNCNKELNPLQVELARALGAKFVVCKACQREELKKYE